MRNIASIFFILLLFSAPAYTQNHSGHFINNGTIGGSAGIFAEIPVATINPSDNLFGFRSSVISGKGYTYGLFAESSTLTPVSNGRSYGVVGVAGNATSGYNYGVVGRVVGSNDGAAVVGVDGNLHTSEGAVAIPGKWAGYFLGNSHFSNKVLIGTTTIPSSAQNDLVDVSLFNLYVKDGILTEEVIISEITTWADYVFEPEYQLKPLSEVENFIKKEGHLPNMPSAKEVKDEGLKMSEIIIQQQEKIEELYLHIIELNKKVERLEKQVLTTKE